MRMKVLGITGGIGAGKSSVLAYLEHKYGARVLQSDLVAHELQKPGQECHRQIASVFGNAVLREDRTIDREKLGKIVYASPEKLQQLNQIVHPAVKNRIIAAIEEERAAGKAPFVVVEAALLLEDHYDRICDEIWCVTADETERRRRLAADRGYSPEKIDAVLKNQKNDAQYRAACKFVIDNSGDFVDNTEEQIDKGLIEHGFL